MHYFQKHELLDTYAARPGVHRKELAVKAAVKEQSRRLTARAFLTMRGFAHKLGLEHADYGLAGSTACSSEML